MGKTMIVSIEDPNSGIVRRMGSFTDSVKYEEYVEELVKTGCKILHETLALNPEPAKLYMYAIVRGHILEPINSRSFENAYNNPNAPLRDFFKCSTKDPVIDIKYSIDCLSDKVLLLDKFDYVIQVSANENETIRQFESRCIEIAEENIALVTHTEANTSSHIVINEYPEILNKSDVAILSNALYNDLIGWTYAKYGNRFTVKVNCNDANYKDICDVLDKMLPFENNTFEIVCFTRDLIGNTNTRWTSHITTLKRYRLFDNDLSIVFSNKQSSTFLRSEESIMKTYRKNITV